MNNVTMQRLSACARLGAAAVVTLFSMHGMTLDPSLMEIIFYIGATLLVGGYAGWKDNNITSGRIAAQGMVEVVKADYKSNRRGEEDEWEDIIEDILEVLDFEEDDDDVEEEAKQ